MMRERERVMRHDANDKFNTEMCIFTIRILVICDMFRLNILRL